jgi:multiple RNA-binding domain-containing protein 1
MQHPTKTKTWANDEDMGQTLAPTVNPPLLETGQSSEGTAQTQTKKQITNRATETTNLVARSSRNDSKDEVPPNVTSHGAPEVQEQDTGAIAVAVEQENEGQPKSDADWLRSKTSRLLGLLDEEEQGEHDAKILLDTANDDNDGRVNTIGITAKSETEEAGDSPDGGETAGERDFDADVELIRISGRLFVRNLPYDASETDLEPVFSPFGKIEEVSRDSFSTISIFTPLCSYDDHPDRDI